MNQTRAEAFERVALAKIGSHAGNPSVEYLQGLQEFIYRWLMETETALTEATAKECEAQAIAEAEAREQALIDEANNFDDGGVQ